MDPVLKLAVDIQNSEDVKKLTAYLDQQAQAVKALNAQFAQGTLNQQQYNSAVAQLGPGIQNANKQLQALGGASGFSAQGLLQLSYAADDAAYGFSAIVNNIPGLVASLGGSAGMAGAIAIAGVAVRTLINHWSELAAALQSNWSGGSAEQLRILAERAEKAAGAFEKLKTRSTEFEGKANTALEKSFVEAGVEQTRKAITDAMMATGQGAEKQTIRKLGFVDRFVAEKALGRKIPFNKQEQSQIQYADTAKQAAQLMADTSLPGQAGTNARSRLKGLMDQNPAAFPPNLRAGIEAGTPEAQKKAEQFAKQSDAKAEIEKRIKADTKAKDDAAEAKAKIVAGVEKQNFEEAKRRQIEGLQDQREAIQRNLQVQQEKIWQQQHLQRAPQVLEGAKAAIDMYQKGIGGVGSPRELAKRGHDLQQEANKKLQIIADELKKEQRLRLAR
jgi:hypothetical protein